MTILSDSPALPVRLTLLPGSPQHPFPLAPYNRWPDARGEDLAQFFRVGAGHVVRFPGVADFTVALDGHAVTVVPVPGGDAVLAEHLLLNQVIPLALTRQQQVVLHAGAVVIGGAAVAFVGSSGRGKSTLTAGFALAGHAFLTDDGLLLWEREGQTWAVPSHASVRLSDDARRALFPGVSREPHEDQTDNKARLRASAALPHCDREQPLLRVYLLGDGTAVQPVITPAQGSDAVMGLAGNCFLLDPADTTLVDAQFRRFVALVRDGLCYHLDYPRRFGGLPAVRDAVLAHLGQDHPRGFP